jgi:hypothetical protein
LSWRGLRRKAPLEFLFTEEWNAVVDSLNDLYAALFTGTGDVYFDELVANKATFNTRPYAEGRPVILDGDPISIYTIYDYARDKIVEAVNLAKVTGTADIIRQYVQESRDILSALYEKAPSKAGVKEAIETSITTTYIREVRDKVVGIRVDAYGNVGIRIAEPLDEYSRVKVAPPSELLDEFKPVSASGSVAAAANTAGLEVKLYKGGRPNVNIYYSAGGAAEVRFEVSLDGATWRTVDVISLAVAGSGFKAYSSIAYPWVRLYSPTTAVDLELELVASR